MYNIHVRYVSKVSKGEGAASYIIHKCINSAAFVN